MPRLFPAGNKSAIDHAFAIAKIEILRNIP
jgi:hypothetical protein